MTTTTADLEVVSFGLCPNYSCVLQTLYCTQFGQLLSLFSASKCPFFGLLLAASISKVTLEALNYLINDAVVVVYVKT